MAKTMFRIGESVVATNKEYNCVGKVISYTQSRDKKITTYLVDDGVLQRTYNECDLKKFMRKSFAPTENEFSLIKNELPFVKKSKLEIVYERNKFFVFKFTHSGGQYGFGQFLNGVYTQLDEKQYMEWATYVG